MESYTFELVNVTGVVTVFARYKTPPLPRFVDYVEYTFEMSASSIVMSLSTPYTIPPLEKV
jgi:hypothetical protein